MIDLHCHILAETDDGPSTIEESLEMAAQAHREGISAIVATPHTLNGVYYNSKEDVCGKVDRLNEMLIHRNIQMTLFPGAEVHFNYGLSDKLESGDIFTMNNTNRYLLLEFPAQILPDGYKDEIFKIKLKGVTPIIAHPERNFVILRDNRILYDLIALGCLCQITSASITGDFGDDVKRLAHKMLKLNLAHIIATDAHSFKDRGPNLSSGVKAAGKIMKNMESAYHMVTTIPQKIIEGKKLDIPEPLEQKKKKWYFFGLK